MQGGVVEIQFLEQMGVENLPEANVGASMLKHLVKLGLGDALDGVPQLEARPDVSLAQGFEDEVAVGKQQRVADVKINISQRRHCGMSSSFSVACCCTA